MHLAAVLDDQRHALAERIRSVAEPTGVFLFGLLAVALVAGSTGGYLQTTQGWTAVMTLGVSAVTLLLRRAVRVGVTEIVFVAGILAFTGWVALSALWTPSLTATFTEVQRDLAYVGIAVSGVVLVRRRTSTQLLGGVLAGIAVLSLYALGTRLVPDRIGSFDSESFGYRLATPITYWNGLGIFAIVGALLAVAFAARGRSYLVRALAAATIPMLLLTNMFTFSRGAWLALALGLIVVALADPRRLQYLAVVLALAPFPAVAVWLASRKSGLTTAGSTFGQAIDEGHAMVVPTLILCGGSALVGGAALLAERRVRVPGAARAAFAGLLAAGVVAGVGVAWHYAGSPSDLASRAWNGFVSPYRGTGPDATDRLFQFSSGGRVELWKVSWHAFGHDPLKGTGAGSYAQEWVAHRPVASTSTEGHSLYFEVMGELGIVGLVLLLTLILAPVRGAFAARREAHVMPVLGAYAAFALHAGIDWDWELTGVGGGALLVGAGLIRSRGAPWALRPPVRWSAVAATLAVGVVALLGLAGAESIRSATDALGRDDPSQALADLDDAERWMPWSATPAELKANAYLSSGRRKAAADAYREAIAKDRTNWLLWSALAGASTGAERREALARVRELNPLNG